MHSSHSSDSLASSRTAMDEHCQEDNEKRSVGYNRARELEPAQERASPNDTEEDFELPASSLPLNWPARKKWCNLLLISTLTLLTPFASSMFAPAISLVTTDLSIPSADLATFTVSVYLLGYAFGPLFLAPLSELHGRVPVYQGTTLLFIVGNVACALSTNTSMLIVFRFWTGCFGAGPLTVGPASVGDCFAQTERGRAMAVWTMPVLLGPCLGPAVGAYVAKAIGWRWLFWILCIATGVVLIICFFALEETHKSTLVRRHQRKQHHDTETGLKLSRTKSLPDGKTPTQLFASSIIRPTKMLCLSPIILGLSLLTAVAYGTLYLLFTTVTDVFVTRYGIVTNVGLVYLGFGVGQFAGLFVFGLVSDAMMRKLTTRNGGEMKPEYRLPPMLPGAAMIPVGLLIYGWSAQYHVFWFVPIIGTFLIGFGMISVFTPVGTYLVDAFPEHAASATAANTVFRSIGGALLPLAGSRMYASLGQGWGNTTLAGCSLGLMGMILLAIRYGEMVRTEPRFQLKL